MNEINQDNEDIIREFVKGYYKRAHEAAESTSWRDPAKPYNPYEQGFWRVFSAIKPFRGSRRFEITDEPYQGRFIDVLLQVKGYSDFYSIGSFEDNYRWKDFDRHDHGLVVKVEITQIEKIDGLDALIENLEIVYN